MSVMTTEKVAIGAAEPLSLVDLLVDTAALVARIGEDRVVAVTMGRGTVTLDLRPGQDAWQVGRSLGLSVQSFQTGPAETERVSFGVLDQAGTVPFVEVRSETLPGDPDHYEAPAYRVSDRRQARAHAGRRGWTDRD